MFRDILKMPIRRPVRSDFWACPTRLREAAKMNTKPYIKLTTLHPLKPQFPSKK
jgi:hypothetical protein